MNVKLTILALLLLYNAQVFAQVNATDFEIYLKQQNTMLNQAYTKKDPEAAEQILKAFIVKYNTLSREGKVAYKSFIAGSYYNVSCVYSVNNNKPKSLAFLDSAVNNGYVNYRQIKEDPDFTNIKNEEEFKRISYYVRSVGDYDYILKNAAKFNEKDPRIIPLFSYQSATDPNLVTLRRIFKLDSIAGQGNDSSRAINILHWVHTTVKHDGQHESGIKFKNANEIISVSSAKKVGVSCGELATTLNECYLALGFKTRKVYCFPKDSLNTDYDSHVINLVYLPSKKKWIWADPTNDAYVMDENKNLLSIQEVRERLIAGKPLKINADANYNHQSSVTGEDYFRYMTKNLYRFYSPLKSEYDYESRSKNKTITYVYLMPLDYFKQGPDRSIKLDKATMATIEGYRTNNDEQFWKINGK